MVTSSATHIELRWDPAYDDGGSPIEEYQLYMDQVEGVGEANVENWVLQFAGKALTYTVTTGLTPKKSYRFKVLAKNEYDILSQYSDITEWIAAALPAKITFPANPFSEYGKTSLLITWITPVINAATMIPINYYKVYWDEGYRNSGDFALLSQVTSYDQNFYRVTNLETGRLYKFQISAVNDVGEGILSNEIVHYAMSLPAAPQTPYIITSVKTGAATASATIGWYAVI